MSSSRGRRPDRGRVKASQGLAVLLQQSAAAMLQAQAANGLHQHQHHIHSCSTAVGQSSGKPEISAGSAESTQKTGCLSARCVYSGSYGSRAISNISWATAKLGVDLETFEPGLTCKLVADFVKSIQATNANNRPNAQDSANFFWALGVWKHLPPDAAISIMWAHSVALVEDAEQPCTPQERSNLLYALAQLGLAVTQKDAHILLNSILGDGSSTLTVQNCANTAWSLAVLRRLHCEGLQALLNKIFLLQLTMQHASSDSTYASLRQMYQALYALQPPQDAPCEQQERWDQLQRSLSKLGRCPSLRCFSGKEQLTAALSKMDVGYEVDVPLSTYMAAAVIWPCVRHAPNVIVTINLREFDYIKNRVNRLSGPALFRHALLAKHGQQVVLPEDKLRLSSEELAAYLRQQVEAVTGRSLQEYRKTAC